MGDIAEAMLDGTLCAECGVYMGADTGYPVRCSRCRTETPPQAPIRRPYRCPMCGKKIANMDDALIMHTEAAHNKRSGP